MDEMDKKDYELAVLVKTEDDLAPVMALVRQHNAEIVAEPRAKKLALAYEIKKNKEIELRNKIRTLIFSICVVLAGLFYFLFNKVQM